MSPVETFACGGPAAMLLLESAEFVNTDRMTVGCRKNRQAEESFASLEMSLKYCAGWTLWGASALSKRAETSCRP
jgi:hypothetical protein